jgi:3-deoxy-D-manno-octulosonic-acid transferase
MDVADIHRQSRSRNILLIPMLTFLLYDIGIVFYVAAIHIAAFFYPKAMQWVSGRKNWPQKLEVALAEKFDGVGKRIWVHCASLGEFEQGRPLIESIVRDYPDAKILLSFFSPSGYEIRKDYALANHVCYLPADTPAQVNLFLNIAKPDIAIFVKYEFWLRMLYALQKRKIPVLLVSAVFRPQQLFFRPAGYLWLQALKRFNLIFVQDAGSEALLRKFGIEQVKSAGDTRIDRVLQLANTAERYCRLDIFAEGANLLIVGSSWPKDEAIFLPLINEDLPENWRVVIAPHHITEKTLRRLETQIVHPSVRYSQAEEHTLRNAKILLQDNVGMLGAIYQYGKLAYIGGGFGAGIHNTLEPMAFGLPVIFGPRYKKFAEAVNMVEHGGAFVIHHPDELRLVFQMLNSPKWENASTVCRSYIRKHQGASSKIMAAVSQYID